ncbi:hypothetical protein ACR3K2_32000 [Cryptosporidium serpentis]
MAFLDIENIDRGSSLRILTAFLGSGSVENDFKLYSSEADFIILRYNIESKYLLDKWFDTNSSISQQFNVISDIQASVLHSFLYRIFAIFYKFSSSVYEWFGYNKYRIKLENTSNINFEISDEYSLLPQNINFWEFDVRSCSTRISRLILGSINFTYFSDRTKQMTCIKSLRYSLKELVWKNFLSELLTGTYDISQENCTTFVNLSNQMSIVLTGTFYCNDTEEILSLNGHGRLIPLCGDSVHSSSSCFKSKACTHILDHITFTQADLFYMNSVFPPRKVLGPDFQEIVVPLAILGDFDSKTYLGDSGYFACSKHRTTFKLATSIHNQQVCKVEHNQSYVNIVFI